MLFDLGFPTASFHYRLPHWHPFWLSDHKIKQWGLVFIIWKIRLLRLCCKDRFYLSNSLNISKSILSYFFWIATPKLIQIFLKNPMKRGIFLHLNRFSKIMIRKDNLIDHAKYRWLKYPRIKEVLFLNKFQTL